MERRRGEEDVKVGSLGKIGLGKIGKEISLFSSQFSHFDRFVDFPACLSETFLQILPINLLAIFQRESFLGKWLETKNISRVVRKLP